MRQNEADYFPKWAYTLALFPLLVFIFDITHSQDQEWFLKINHLANIFPDILWTNLSLLGNGWSLFAITFPLILLARKQLYAGIISGIFTGILSNLCKSFFQTDRPAGVIDPQLFHIIENPLLHNAMPSGHTMTAFSVATAIFFTINSNKRTKYVFLFLLATATGVSRIAVGAHWPEDVLVGSALGILSGLIAAQITQSIPSAYLELNKWPIYFIILGSFISFYLLTMDKIDFHLNQTSQYILAGIIFVTWIRLIPLLKQVKQN